MISLVAWSRMSFPWTHATSSRQLRYVTEWHRALSFPLLPSISLSMSSRILRSTRTVPFSKTYLPWSYSSRWQWGFFSWESFRYFRFQSRKWGRVFRHFWKTFLRFVRTWWQISDLPKQFFSRRCGLSCRVRAWVTIHRVWVFWSWWFFMQTRFFFPWWVTVFRAFNWEETFN